MFEKEAEKWTIDYVCKDCSRYKECKSKEHCTCKNCSKEKWQNGAEFGYNKANEWHFVKDGDIPKDEDYKLCITDDGNYYIARYEELFVHWSNQEYKEVCCPYAWREIVPPKEIKEK